MDASFTFEQLCERYRPILRSIIDARLDPRLLQRVDASDVVQEALLEAFSRLEEYQAKQPMPLAAWLRQTALQQLNLAYRRHRHAQRRSVLRQVSYEQSSVYRLAEQMSAVHSKAEQQQQMLEDAQRTWLCLEQLAQHDREILLLRYVNGLSNAAAAEVLAVSETVASKRHCRALLRLQQRIQQQATDDSSGTR